MSKQMCLMLTRTWGVTGSDSLARLPTPGSTVFSCSNCCQQAAIPPVSRTYKLFSLKDKVLQAGCPKVTDKAQVHGLFTQTRDCTPNTTEKRYRRFWERISDKLPSPSPISLCDGVKLT